MRFSYQKYVIGIKIYDDDSRIRLEMGHKIFVRLNFKGVFRVDKKKGKMIGETNKKNSRK